LPAYQTIIAVQSSRSPTSVRLTTERILPIAATRRRDYVAEIDDDSVDNEALRARGEEIESAFALARFLHG